jgi:hypothetical protein
MPGAPATRRTSPWPAIASLMNVKQQGARGHDREEDRTLHAMEVKLNKKVIVKAVPDLQETRYEVIGVEAAA